MEPATETLLTQPGALGKFLGCLIGSAIGDALGMPLEFLKPEDIQRRYGNVTEYLTPDPEHACGHLHKGQYTDDTQLTLALAESLIEAKGFDPEAFKKKLIAWYRQEDRRAPGQACLEGAHNLSEGVFYKESGKPNAAGNGTAMRVAPLGLVYSGEDLIRHSYVQSLMTHNDPRASIGSILTAFTVNKLLKLTAPLDPPVFLKEMRGMAVHLEKFFKLTPPEYSEKLYWMGTRLGEDFEETLEQIGTGGYVVDTVSACLWTLLSFPEDFEEALVRVVNRGDDADTLGAITGALVGTHVGIARIPRRWIEGLEGVDRLALVSRALFALARHIEHEPEEEEAEA